MAAHLNWLWLCVFTKIKNPENLVFHQVFFQAFGLRQIWSSRNMKFEIKSSWFILESSCVYFRHLKMRVFNRIAVLKKICQSHKKNTRVKGLFLVKLSSFPWVFKKFFKAPLLKICENTDVLITENTVSGKPYSCIFYY